MTFVILQAMIPEQGCKQIFLPVAGFRAQFAVQLVCLVALGAFTFPLQSQLKSYKSHDHKLNYSSSL